MLRCNGTAVGFLGPEGTYSHLAARCWRKEKKCSLMPYQSLPALVAAAAKGEVSAAVVPIENSVEGTVGLVLDLLTQHREIKIAGEVVLPVHHQLLAKYRRRMHEITRVISHAQAVGQCRHWLDKYLPGVEVVEVSSTAAAVKLVAESSEPWAAIGTKQAADLYRLHCLAADINDCPNNSTRFIVLSTQEPAYSSCCKTSLEFSLTHQPGALYTALGEFAARGINLTRIESRPAKTALGEYRFFVDFAGHYNDAAAAEVLAALKNSTNYLRILGSYPAAKS